MKRGASFLSGAAAVLLEVAISGWLFCLAKINIDYAVMRINFAYLCLTALAAYALNRALFRRGLPVPVFVLVQLLLAACAVFVFIRSVCLEPMKLRTMLIVGTVYTFTIPTAAFAAYEAPRKNGLLLCFELSAVLLAILLLLDRFLELPALRPCAVMCLVSLAAALLALVAERAGRLSGASESVAGNRSAGQLILALCFAAVLGLAAAAAAVASVGIRAVASACAAAIRWIWAQILAGLTWLWGMIESFFLWLSQFFEPVELDGVVGEPPMAEMDESELLQEMSAQIPWWFYAILLAFVAALLGWLVWKLRSYRFGRLRLGGGRSAEVTMRESTALSALRDALKRLYRALRYRLNCLLLRRTAPGLLAWCEKRAPKPEARRTGESGEAFLRRLAASLDAQPLSELASLVERSFYAPAGVPVPPELYRQVRRTKFT